MCNRHQDDIETNDGETHVRFESPIFCRLDFRVKQPLNFRDVLPIYLSSDQKPGCHTNQLYGDDFISHYKNPSIMECQPRVLLPLLIL